MRAPRKALSWLEQRRGYLGASSKEGAILARAAKKVPILSYRDSEFFGAHAEIAPSCCFDIIRNNIKPSSSAPVESEIRKIKHGVLQKRGKLTRVDITAEKINDYYDGRLRILDEKEEENFKSSLERSAVVDECERDKDNSLEFS